MSARQIEILAPAGTFETMQAAVRAGADAVYLGGSRFGARAYAQNLDTEQLLRAIDYVHLHGRRLYLTVNTLLKETELEELYPYIKPLYEEGLDAAIVQDFGALQALKSWFPQLRLHASTQMTVAGPEGAALLQKSGVSRLVTPRELSLEEIRQIRAECTLEIESFVHGALCYCYSGQCLMSSLIGGRSGNRGRCAQPCRLPYRAYDRTGCVSRPEEPYLLSPKDMNTLAILPDIIEAGVDSLKIEGRMKKPVYTAGVTELYRRYADRYLEYGKEGYHVEPSDERQLFDLFNRNGFHESYYRQHNGKNMMALTQKEFRFGNEALAARLQETYLAEEKREGLQLRVRLKAGQPTQLTLTLPAAGCRPEVSVTVSGMEPQTAKNRPMTEEDVRRQLGKLGNTEFKADRIEAEVGDGLFLPLVQLNELRRAGVEAVTEGVQKVFRRQPVEAARNLGGFPRQARGQNPELRALAVNFEQADVLRKNRMVSRIYIESEAGENEELQRFAAVCRLAGKECYLALPYVFRSAARKRFSTWKEQLDVFDGFLVRSLDGLAWLGKNGPQGKPITADAGLYSWNNAARVFLAERGVAEDTVPLELNRREIAQRGASGSELIVYGRAPMMISAQCVRKNTIGCRPGTEPLWLTDRKGESLPVRTICRYCCNIIYNSKPLSLFALREEAEGIGASAFRLSFSTESARETEEIVEKCFREDPSDFTRGHWKRGVE